MTGPAMTGHGLLDGKVVVVTASGIIAASLEPRRLPYYYRW